MVDVVRGNDAPPRRERHARVAAEPCRFELLVVRREVVHRIRGERRRDRELRFRHVLDDHVGVHDPPAQHGREVLLCARGALHDHAVVGTRFPCDQRRSSVYEQVVEHPPCFRQQPSVHASLLIAAGRAEAVAQDAHVGDGARQQRVQHAPRVGAAHRQQRAAGQPTQEHGAQCPPRSCTNKGDADAPGSSLLPTAVIEALTAAAVARRRPPGMGGAP